VVTRAEWLALILGAIAMGVVFAIIVMLGTY
jgi:hypothetical protein